MDQSQLEDPLLARPDAQDMEIGGVGVGNDPSDPLVSLTSVPPMSMDQSQLGEDPLLARPDAQNMGIGETGVGNDPSDPLMSLASDPSMSMDQFRLDEEPLLARPDTQGVEIGVASIGNEEMCGVDRLIEEDESQSTSCTDLLKGALINSLRQKGQSGPDHSLRPGITLPTATIVCTDGRQVRVLFDQGAQITLVRRSFANLLKLKPVRQIYFAMSGINQTKEPALYDVVTLTLLWGTQYIPLDAVVTDNFPDSFMARGLSKAALNLRLSGVVLADHYPSDVVDCIQVLVGCDNYFKVVTAYQQIEGYHLLATPAGYMVSGPVGGISRQISNKVAVCRFSVHPLEQSDMIEEDTLPMHKLWDLDSLGITEGEGLKEDQVALQDYRNSTLFEDGQYWVRLPFRSHTPALPHNRARAVAMLRHSLRELHKTPHHLEIYDAAIQQLLENKFIEEVPKDARTDNVHYLPHHGVKKDSVSTPLRVVFNASSKAPGGVSLNDCLLTGPNMTEKLADSLLKFRTCKYGFSADISKAFLRIGLLECDRDYTRFYWVENPTVIDSDLKEFRFRSVLFGATSSPFLLQATLDFHLESSNHPSASSLRGLFYMDNLLGSVETKEELEKIYFGANDIMHTGNFPLQQWATNSQETQRIMEAQGDVPEKDLGILGYFWKTDSDMITLKQPPWTPLKMTKRNLLRLVSMLFDPLGLISPLSILGRSLMQKAHKLQVDWDRELPKDFEQSWEEILKEIHDPTDILFPRSVINTRSDPSLHVFCDASGKAYGAVAYVVTGETSHILTSRARVVPIEPPTLPRLELLSILVGVRLLKYIVDTLSFVNFSQLHVWADSEASIQWVRNNQSAIVFVRNQIEKIRTIRNAYPFTLLHVPTKDNPADLLSRGTTKKKLRVSNWWYGPSWLTDQEQWPSQKGHVAIYELTTELGPQPLIPVIPAAVFDEQIVSSWGDLLRRTQMVFKAAELFAARTSTRLNLPSPGTYWFQKVQAEHYPLVISIVRDGLSVNRVNPSQTLVDQLGLYWDTNTGLVRCRGRLSEAAVSFETNCPILLPSNTHITTLFVRFHHLCAYHDGVNGTLVSVRQQVWIPKGRATVKRILRQCVSCARKFRAPFKQPGPPALPAERVTFNRAFEHIGVDYSGHILVKDSDNEGILTKIYICLFTCMASRAVHLELARDLTAETFLNLFNRFIYEHGVPRTIVSDNGTNFVATAAALKNIQADVSVRDYTEAQNITWKFIRPRAPWEGGFYERLIGVVKTAVHKMLSKQTLSVEEMTTLLKGAQVCVNNRPLTYVNSDDPLDTPLTPNHLIKGRRVNLFPPVEMATAEDPDYDDPEALRASYNHSVTLRHRFQDVWRKDYLTALRQRHLTPSLNQRLDLQEGDIVLVENELTRDYWPLGRVLKLLSDSHNQVRAVEVWVNGKSIQRTLNHIVPLEVSRRHRESDSRQQPFEQAWTALEPDDSDPLEDIPTGEPRTPVEEEPTDGSVPIGSLDDEDGPVGSDPPVNAEPPMLPAVAMSDASEQPSHSRQRRKAALKAIEKFNSWGRDDLI